MPAWVSRVGILGDLSLSPGDRSTSGLGVLLALCPQWAGPVLPPVLMRALALTQNTLSHQLTSGLRTTFSICI